MLRLPTPSCTKAYVALAARRRDALVGVHTGLERQGSQARTLVVPTDVTDRQQVKSLVARTEEALGPVDILVNCAGVMFYSFMKNRHEDDWERTVDVLCKGMRNCVGAVLGGCSIEGGGTSLPYLPTPVERSSLAWPSTREGGKFFVEALSRGCGSRPQVRS